MIAKINIEDALVETTEQLKELKNNDPNTFVIFYAALMGHVDQAFPIEINGDTIKYHVHPMCVNVEEISTNSTIIDRECSIIPEVM